ncbi:DUF4169 family protein [uncultured Litoreibacter sp.]|uniref:DUF4169 family protein n=1 Tax=uncultured Litoreibacter sp. TaxID=1392394 RepID=UPI0026110C71|nr:DUF4169 family protein [uncultured Litoreibacter sp.]
MKPVNLNKFRKAKARADKKARANANVIKHGRKGVEKLVDKAAHSRQKAHIDGHKLDQTTD